MATAAKKAAPASAGAAPTEIAPVEPVPALVPASESSDPAVHYLIAERSAHTDNGDQQAADAVTAQLAELGYR